MHKILLGLVLPLFLAACGAQPIWAPDAAVQRAAYKFDGPPKLTLFTVINNRSGAGAHAGLMINASQRVIFDPAGTWWNKAIPERNDVQYGISPQALKLYIDYHARSTYRVVVQELVVSPEVAEMALREVQAYGAVNKGFCTRSISTILSRLPGFEDFKVTFFPKRAMAQFAKYPGVTTRTIYDNDANDHTALLKAQQG